MSAVSAADLHDSRAAVPLRCASRRPCPFVERLFTDAAYRGPGVAPATPIDIEIDTGPPDQRGFVVQKRQWVVERTFAWLGRCRRLARNYERLVETACGFLALAAAMILVRRITTASTG